MLKYISRFSLFSDSVCLVIAIRHLNAKYLFICWSNSVDVDDDGGNIFCSHSHTKALLHRCFSFSSPKKVSEEIKIKNISKLGNLCAWNIHEMQIFTRLCMPFSLKIVRIYLHLPDRKEFTFWWSSLAQKWCKTIECLF